MTDDTTYTCRKCGIEKIATAFYGRNRRCIQCYSLRARQRRQEKRVQELPPPFVNDKGCIEVALIHNKTAYVDQIDSDLLEFHWKLRLNRGDICYVAIHNYYGDDRVIKIHRIILARMLNRELLPTEMVDHKNSNGLDNRRENLRPANAVENMRNQRKSKSSKSPYKGITKTGNKWRARIGLDNRRIELGLFDTPEAAYAAYCLTARNLYGEFANLPDFEAVEGITPMPWMPRMRAIELEQEKTLDELIPNLLSELGSIRRVAEAIGMYRTGVADWLAKNGYEYENREWHKVA